MKLSRLILVAAAFMLSACSSSHRPVYSGHEESTKDVPGFSKSGKKKTPYAKLGQSYSVDGETYVPRHQPDYVEEGMASWYGPGFHGGKTANGEAFDKYALTAAHRTLPLPSIVKVTMLSTGKEAIVRVNDRGPFAKGRIIDLSYGAAKEIGLIGKGTAKVRVEYMREESERFAALLVEGREPTSIDLAEEVLSKSSTQYAANETKNQGTSWVDSLNPVSSAEAAKPEWKTLPPSDETHDAASTDVIAATDLPAPESAKPAPIQTASLDIKTSSPFAVLDEKPAPAVAGVEEHKHFLQLGAFLQQANADRLRLKAAKLGPVKIESKVDKNAPLLYVVRMGPYASVDESAPVVAQLNALGVNPKLISQ